eukprot:753443-Pleurochrysis_carterae.AAC.1
MRKGEVPGRESGRGAREGTGGPSVQCERNRSQPEERNVQRQSRPEPVDKQDSPSTTGHSSPHCPHTRTPSAIIPLILSVPNCPTCTCRLSFHPRARNLPRHILPTLPAHRARRPAAPTSNVSALLSNLSLHHCAKGRRGLWKQPGLKSDGPSSSERALNHAKNAAKMPTFIGPANGHAMSSKQ